ncbi:MAG: leucine-rich repeat domain-containing protein, partial [Clostridia bacterium]|nr:leucine-rich repeat domain-containing protein [Clostridia bacterium]
MAENKAKQKKENAPPKPARGLKRFWFWLNGLDEYGKAPKPLRITFGRQLGRFFTVILAFLGIFGLALVAYQLPRISAEGGFRILWLEEILDQTRTDEEKIYDNRATVEEAFAYRIKSDGTVAIAGYVGKENIVILPRTIDGKTITEIDAGAFTRSEIYSITLCNSITVIGDNAFYGCPYLTEITLSKSLTSIGRNAFSGCVLLEKVVIPQGVTVLKSNTFS